MTPRRALPVAVLLVTSCSTCSPEPTPSPSAETHAFCKEAVPAYCAWMAACHPAQVNETVAECITLQSPDCDFDLRAYDREAAAGRLAWDADRARACIAALAAPRCGSEPFDTCRDLFVPRASPGGACYDLSRRWELNAYAGFANGECAGPRFCPYGTCAATCPAPVALGQPCAGPGQFCAEDAYCSFTNGCQPRALLGASCSFSSDCRADLWCAGGDGAPCSLDNGPCGCAASKAGGEPCVSPLQCAANLGCYAGSCRVHAGKAGEPCARTRRPACEPGLLCLRAAEGDLTGTCAPRRAAGERCFDGSDCADGLLCRTDGLCGRPSGPGGPCALPAGVNREGDCAAGLACSGSACVARPTALGSSCTLTAYCFGHAVWCTAAPGTSGQCAPRVGAGQSCAPPASCEVGSSCDPVTLRCVAGVVGSPCTLWIHCQSGICGTDQRCAAPCLGP